MIETQVSLANIVLQQENDISEEFVYGLENAVTQFYKRNVSVTDLMC